MKLRNIRIAQVEFKGISGFSHTRFEVALRPPLDGERPMVVQTPDEAVRVAEALSQQEGSGYIYRGHLPKDWTDALGHYPRS